MIKIQSAVRDIVLGEIEAYFALTHGYMNMSSYAHRIKPKVELLTKKQTTIASLVVSLSRLAKEFKKEKPLIRDVPIKNITTKLPLSEIAYENTNKFLEQLESLHKNISVSQEDFFTITRGTTEIDIICSSNLENKILKKKKKNIKKKKFFFLKKRGEKKKIYFICSSNLENKILKHFKMEPK